MLWRRIRSKSVKQYCKISTQTDTFWPQLYIVRNKLCYIGKYSRVEGGGEGRGRNIIVCDLRLRSGSGCELRSDGLLLDSCGNFGATYRSDLQQSVCPEILITNYHHTTPHIITQKMFSSLIHTICLFFPISGHIKLFSFPNTHSSTLAIFTLNNNSNSHSQYLPSVNQCSTVMLYTAVSVTVLCILLSAL